MFWYCSGLLRMWNIKRTDRERHRKCCTNVTHVANRPHNVKHVENAGTTCCRIVTHVANLPQGGKVDLPTIIHPLRFFCQF